VNAPESMVTRAMTERKIRRYVREARRRLLPLDDVIIARDVECWPDFQTRGIRLAFFVRIAFADKKRVFGGGVAIPYEKIVAATKDIGVFLDICDTIDTVIDRANDAEGISREWLKEQGEAIRIVDDAMEFYA